VKTSSFARFPTSSSLARLVAFLLAAAPVVHAANGRWIGPKNGGWGAPENWADGVIAGGPDAVATFDADGAQTLYVGVDVGRTIGHLVLKGRKPWEINGARLTLAVTGTDEQPTISVLDGHHLLPCGLAGSQGFVKRGGSHLYLSGENSYAGPTFVSTGHLYAMNPRSLGLSGPGNNTVVTHTAQLHITRGIQLDEDIVLFRTATGDSNNLYIDNGENVLTGTLTVQRGGASSQTYGFGVQVSEGSLLVTGAVAGRLTPGATPGAAGMDANVLRFRVRQGARAELAGVVSDGDIGAGGLSLRKTDPGVLVLGAANAYSGSTVCDGGLLLVNNTRGSATGSGSVFVNAGATLGGVGGIAPGGSATITFANGATVAPGAGEGRDSRGRPLTFYLGATGGEAVFRAGARLDIALSPRGSDHGTRLAFTGLAKRRGVVVRFEETVVDFTLPAGASLPPGVYPVASFDAPDSYAGRLVLGSGLEDYDAALVHDPAGIHLRVAGRR
jgi:autotransporter-associated beta strand repeat